jgi:hypothetical protein
MTLKPLHNKIARVGVRNRPVPMPRRKAVPGVFIEIDGKSYRVLNPSAYQITGITSQNS